MLVELRVVSRGDKVCLNPSAAEDEESDAERHSEEEGRCLVLLKLSSSVAPCGLRSCKNTAHSVS